MNANSSEIPPTTNPIPIVGLRNSYVSASSPKVNRMYTRLGSAR